MALKGMRKSDLQRLASQLNINSDGLKANLETRIVEHLLENKALLSKNPEFSSYYEDSLEDTGSFVNNVKGSSRKKSVVVQKTNVKRPLFATNQSDSFDYKFKNHSEASLLYENNKARHRFNELVNESSDAASESVLSETICISGFNGGCVLKDTFNSCFQYDVLFDKLLNIRKCLSKVLMLDFLFCIYEFYNLLSFLIPWSYKAFLPLFSSFFDYRILYLPDLSVIFSFEKFWSPFLTWWIFTIFIPLIVATIFNFHESRKGEGFKIIDPMTFAVVKTIVVYFIFYKGFQKSFFFANSLSIIKSAIGIDLMFTLSFIGVLYAMYDTLISRK
ncbi:hypothetical protein PNEG_00986 [Pneumocystis murina B123]|uniref:SAP domain-containing protein n=1 Tax=Pneumocystis murina (strain B123) TaxID=1069680 RepID=M7PAH1_PNEMU|nr:hypothetical protein PNEG_00986 [Pneumocystis murina B123]EMR10840.1 hypothetical protein PNEG_00986 [Pneumocystis murina B123]